MIPYTFRSDPTTDPVTTNDYVAVPISTLNETEQADFLVANTSGPLSLNWKNTGANSINVKILGANSQDVDVADRNEVLAETVIAAGASLPAASAQVPISYYQFYWFMHEAAADGDQGASALHGRHSRI